MHATTTNDVFRAEATEASRIEMNREGCAIHIWCALHISRIKKCSSDTKKKRKSETQGTRMYKLFLHFQHHIAPVQQSGSRPRPTVVTRKLAAMG